jgi:osmotically inducible protein OsmC
MASPLLLEYMLFGNQIKREEESMKRSASAHWRGNLRQGQGIINTESGSLSDLSYSFTKRFGDEVGTNPEELIAAAHSSCFAMAISAELEKRNLKADSIDVQANVSLEKEGEGWSIPAVHLQVSASVPGASQDQVREAAETAKANCPVSKLLKANITLEFHLSSVDSVSMQ